MPGEGDRVQVTATPSLADEIAFADIVGSKGLIHRDTTHAREHGYADALVHGPLLLGYVSTTIGEVLAGHPAVYVSQQADFKRPVCAGDRIAVEVSVLSVDEARRILRLSTRVYNPAGELAVDGHAVVKLLGRADPGPAGADGAR